MKNTDQTDPFARLEQTHRRLEDRLEMLVRAAEDLAAGIGASSALADVEEVAGFLSRGALRHVEDEERTLFPRLSGTAQLAGVLAELEKEHVEHRALEEEVKALVASWNGAPPAATSPEVARMVELAKKLKEVYAVHIRREEQELFPRAKKLLAPAVIEEMGREMMDRRPDRGKEDKNRS